MGSIWKPSSAQITLSGVLSALAIAIPFVFRGTPLQIYIPIHVLGEGLVVYSLGPMFGVTNVLPLVAGLMVSLGTAIHHIIDAMISLAVYRVDRPMLLPLLPRSSSLRQ